MVLMNVVAYLRGEDSECGWDTTLRQQDEFWIASTRQLCDLPPPGAEPEIAWQRYGAEGQPEPSTSDQFVQGAAQTITVFYVPGNRIANEEAERRAWRLYGVLKAASDEQPLRVVLWSWPSDKIKGQRADVRVKSERTVPESFYLGSVLRRFGAQEKVSLIGYSFGARIICGALHLASGGTIDSLSLVPESSDEARSDSRFRVLLMAAAAPSSWLLPQGLHQGALSKVERMLILYNPNDSALKHFHMIDPEKQRALGFVGLDSRRLERGSAVADKSGAEDQPRVSQRPVHLEIGNAHDENRYYSSRRILEELQRYGLWGPPNP